MCETALGIHCNFAGFTTIWDESVANTSPLEYQKSLQCWKTMTILSYAIYPFYVESIGFLIKVIYVKKPLYHINGLLVIIYHGHNVKWQPYCKHPNILIVYDIGLGLGLGQNLFNINRYTENRHIQFILINTQNHRWPDSLDLRVGRPLLRSCLTACVGATLRGERGR